MENQVKPDVARWSASSLRRHCAYPSVIDKRPPGEREKRLFDAAIATWSGIGEGPEHSDKAVKRMINSHVSKIRGTAFHAGIERWIRLGEMAQLDDLEVQGWLDAFLADPFNQDSILTSPMVKLEVAWGLGEDGQHLMVEEPEPHIYRSMGGLPLVTAGRADIAWKERFRKVLRSGDYKSGKWAVEPPATNLQANAAGIALARRLGCDAYVPGIWYSRDGYWDWGDEIDVQSEAADEMFEEIRASAALPAAPVPGDHCATCWNARLKTCEAAQR